jgi:hypothetical protein
LRLYGENFVKGAYDGFASFKEKNKGIMLSDNDIYRSYGEVGQMKERYKLGYFTGWLIALHETPVSQIPAGTRLMNLGKGSVLICQTDAFVNGYQVGNRIFRQQCQARCETIWDLDDRVLALLNEKPKLQNISRALFNTGKITGWLMTAAHKCAFYGEIAGKASAGSITGTEEPLESAAPGTEPNPDDLTPEDLADSLEYGEGSDE